MVRAARLAVLEAERRFPVRIAVPPTGLGMPLNRMHVWLDENCGADGWAIAPAGIRGVVNDVVAIFLFAAPRISPF